MKQLAIIKNNFLKIEDTYSPNATKSSEAVRFHPIDDDIRAPFLEMWIVLFMHLVIQDMQIKRRYIHLNKMIILVRECCMFNLLVK